MLLGLETGLDYPQFAEHLRIFSDIFLRLIKVIVAPLILATLITGIAGHGDLREIGRVGIKSLIYFEIVTTLAILLGVAAINLTRAGEGLALTPPASTQPPAAPQSLTAPQSPLQNAPLRWNDFLLHVFPENIVKSAAENQILQVAVFAILFAIALTLVPAPTRAPILNFAESLAQVMFKFTNIVMYYAPVGVGAAMAYTVGHLGMSVLLPLGKLVLTAYAALAAFLFCVLLPIVFFARLPLMRFLRAIAEPATIAFATSTSEAALPRAMECMESFGVPRQIVAFVIPAGYSFNMDGSSARRGLHLRGASGRHAHDLVRAAPDGSDPHAHQQRHCRCTARRPGRAAGHRCHVAPAHRTNLHHHGRRRHHRHGPHRGQRHRQLFSVRGRRPLGR